MANLEKSKLLGRPVKRVLVTIEHIEPRLVQTAFVVYESGEEQKIVATYDTTGADTLNEIGNAKLKSQTRWEGPELLVESWMKAGCRQMHFKDYWSLSADGRTMTMAHRDDDLGGQISILEKQ